MQDYLGISCHLPEGCESKEDWDSHQKNNPAWREQLEFRDPRPGTAAFKTFQVWTLLSVKLHVEPMCKQCTTAANPRPHPVVSKGSYIGGMPVTLRKPQGGAFAPMTLRTPQGGASGMLLYYKQPPIICRLL
jgi:hypothetical protein